MDLGPGLYVAALVVNTVLPAYLLRRGSRDYAMVALAGLYMLNITSAQVFANKLFMILGLVGPAGVWTYAFTVVLDNMNVESFGLRFARAVILTTWVGQALFTMHSLWTVTLQPAPFWSLGGLDPEASESAWSGIFGFIPRIVLASWIAYLVSENLDVTIYARVRGIVQRHLWFRSVVSAVPSLAVDTVIFITIAFTGIVPSFAILDLIMGQLILKWIIGAALGTPLLYLYRAVATPQLIVERH
jgi:uncharacterized integral membrane protein (TIGR00697 family)